MILCINPLEIPICTSVKKDLNLEEILNMYTKYFFSAEEARDEGFVPLDFCVSIRTLYSNKVLKIPFKDTSEVRYYTNLMNADMLPHKGYDLIMYLASIGLMMNVQYSAGFDDIMFQHSQFCPMGLYNPDPAFTNPIIYSHILLSDACEEMFSTFLLKDIELIPISNIHSDCEGNIPALIDTLVEVKEEVKDEQE